MGQRTGLARWGTNAEKQFGVWSFEWSFEGWHSVGGLDEGPSGQMWDLQTLLWDRDEPAWNGTDAGQV